MRSIKELVKWFLYITTGIVIVCAINFGLADMETISSDTLWQILLSAFITAFLTWILCPTEENRKSVFWIRTVLHYAALCVVMVFFGNWCGWMTLNVSGVLMMAVDVAIVYVINYIVYYVIDAKNADEMTRKLKEKYHEE